MILSGRLQKERRVVELHKEGKNYHEHVFINLFVEENRNSPSVDIDNQAQSQNQDNEQGQGQGQGQNNNQEQTTTIINCPPDSRCVIEQ